MLEQLAMDVSPQLIHGFLFCRPPPLARRPDRRGGRGIGLTVPLLRILLVTRFERRHPRRVLRGMPAVGRLMEPRLMHPRLMRLRMVGRASLVRLLELGIELLVRQRG